MRFADHVGDMAMKRFEFFLPTRIVFGPGKLLKIGELVKPLGKKAALISDQGLTELGLVGRIRTYLEEQKVQTAEFTQVTPNPISAMIDDVASSWRQEKIDFVMGIGGGSPIDFAKGLAVALSHKGNIWDYVSVRGKSRSRPTWKTLPVVTVVTTSGTGSEVTPFSILTNPRTSEKCGLVSDCIFPRISIIDPKLTLTVPPRLTASTGVDALCHAIESYIDREAHGFTEMAALEAIRLIASSLSSAFVDGSDMEARCRMAWAATLGGVAISNGNVTLVHAIGHPISGRFNIGHGEAMALGLPAVMRHSWMLNPEKFARIAEAMGVDTSRLGLEEAAHKSVDAVEKLLKEIGMRPRLRDYNIRESDLDQLARDATGYMVGCLEAHPRAFSFEEVREIYRELL